MKIEYVLLFICIFCSCSQKIRKKLQQQGSVLQKNYLVEIPFHYYEDFIILEVIIEKKRYNFLYDTGAEICVIGENLAREINYRTVTKFNAKDSRKVKKKLKFIEIPEIELQSIKFVEIGAAIANLKSLSDYFGCIKIEGILGNNLFRKAKWELDYKNQVIRVSDDIDRLKENSKAVIIPMICGEIGNAYVELEINKNRAKFILDTGYNGKVTSKMKLFEILTKSSEHFENTEMKGVEGYSLFKGLSYGSTYYGYAKQIKIGNQNILNQIITFKERSPNLIGNQLLESFKVIIDWSDKTLILYKNEEIKADTLKAYEYVLWIDHGKNEIKLSNTWETHKLKGTIFPNNRIIEINGIDLESLNEDEFCKFVEGKFVELIRESTLNLLILNEENEEKIELTRKQLLPLEK